MLCLLFIGSGNLIHRRFVTTIHDKAGTSASDLKPSDDKSRKEIINEMRFLSLNFTCATFSRSCIGKSDFSTFTRWLHQTIQDHPSPKLHSFTLRVVPINHNQDFRFLRDILFLNGLFSWLDARRTAGH